MIELWQELQVDARYEVSNLGRVRRGDRSLKPSLMQNGYTKIAVRVAGKLKQLYIHRLVAESFLTPVEGKNWVNHKNGNKFDNCDDNLEWVTPGENIAHAKATGLMRQPRGEEMGLAKLTEADVRKIRTLLASGISQRTVAKQFNVSRGPIDKIANGLTWRHVR